MLNPFTYIFRWSRPLNPRIYLTYLGLLPRSLFSRLCPTNSANCIQCT